MVSMDQICNPILYYVQYMHLHMHALQHHTNTLVDMLEVEWERKT